jgi:hypothetical protein
MDATAERGESTDSEEEGNRATTEKSQEENGRESRILPLFFPVAEFSIIG